MSAIEKILGTDKLDAIVQKFNAAVDTIESIKSNFGKILKGIQDNQTSINNLSETHANDVKVLNQTITTKTTETTTKEMNDYLSTLYS